MHSEFEFVTIYAGDRQATKDQVALPCLVTQS